MTTAQQTAERNDTRARARQHFLASLGWGEAALEPLAGDASFRRYIRLRRGAETAMLMDAPPEKEDVRPYVRVARHLHGRRYGAPEVFGEDAAHGYVLCEDLGDDLFTRVLAKGGAPEAAMYGEAVAVLAAWHADAAMHKSGSAGLVKDYDTAELMREVSLFCDWYLPEALGRAAAAALREEYLALWRGVLERARPGCAHFVHRDYHADNLIWRPQQRGHTRVGLLDFQDAVWGHPAYDLVSLLEDARRDVPEALAEQSIAQYLAQTGQEEASFRTAYAVLGAQRNSKIVGIFVRLARRDGKHAYLSFLPRVWRYLMHDLRHPLLADIRDWTERHVPPAARGAITVA